MQVCHLTQPLNLWDFLKENLTIFHPRNSIFFNAFILYLFQDIALTKYKSFLLTVLLLRDF